MLDPSHTLTRRVYMVVLFLTGCIGGSPCGAQSTDSPPPNIVVIMADDLGFSDLGCYGSEIKTPHLDRLAKHGKQFTQFYNTARCWPTRGAFLTGYYAQQIRRDKVEGVPSGGQGKRPTWAKLLPARLKPFGYRSYHSGKWHVDGAPLSEGFEHSYRLEDHDRYFHPKNHLLDDQPLPAVVDEGEASLRYYATTEIATRTLEQWNEHLQESPNAPFFSFVAFTAPHFPLQAPRGVVDRYRRQYRAGWETIRTQRWQSMKHLNLGASMSETESDIGPPYHFESAFQALGEDEVRFPSPWNGLTETQKVFQADKMAVHAAMVEVMDSEVGRLIDWLESHDRLQNTLIVFLSDNGASAEIMVRGDGHNSHAIPGSAASFLCLGPGWSTVCNTPFRRHKTWVHEGGICTPCIVHWPKAIQANARPVATPAHVIDWMPTLLEIASQRPHASKSPDGGPEFPGVSLVALLGLQPHASASAMPEAAAEERTLWWEHEGNRALRQGRWKIVAAGKDAPWELYDLEQDRVESRNLAAQEEQRVNDLAAVWERLHQRHREDAMREAHR